MYLFKSQAAPYSTRLLTATQTQHHKQNTAGKIQSMATKCASSAV